MDLSSDNGTRWNVYGCLAYLVLPFLPWLIYSYTTELIVSQFHDTGAFIARVLTLTILVIGWARFLIGPSKSFSKLLAVGAVSESRLPKHNDSIFASKNKFTSDTTSLDVSPQPSIQQATRLIEQLVPETSYESLSDENKVLANANVYLQFGRIEQALSLLQEIPYPSTPAQQLIKIVSAVMQQTSKKSN